MNLYELKFKTLFATTYASHLHIKFASANLDCDFCCKAKIITL